MARRPKHPRKEIEPILRQAEQQGFTIRHPFGHWGGLVCPGNCRIINIWSTPRNAGNHAKQLKRAINNCPHKTDH